MFTNHPVAPKQPRRVRSGERAPIRDEPLRGAHRVPSGQRRPIGSVSGEAETRPGAHRRAQPAYAKRRA